MAKRSSQPPQRRGSQTFRSRELLASLTLSADAIAIGGEQQQQPPPQHEQQTKQQQQVPSGASLHPVPAPRLGLARVSQLKITALQMRQRARKERRLRRAAALPVAQEGAAPEETREAASDRIARQPIGCFETTDVKWSAVVEGDIERFMYPSLRLEALYDSSSGGGDAAAGSEARRRSTCSSARHARLAPQQPHSEPLSGGGLDDHVAMPSVEAVAAAMAPSAELDWRLEQRYQNPTQSAPPNGHTRVDGEELKYLQFDQQLEMAECMLRKKEQLDDAELRRELRAAGRAEREAIRGASEPQVQDEAALAAERTRAASLYHPSLAHEPTLIPRLPQTRKILKEIQRHTTSEGQIKYYADKQNLFSKWKKLQAAQQHQPAPRRCSSPGSDDPDDEDDTLHPFGALSPRSLFYHECAKRQVLPEPVFSRINDMQELKTAPAAGNPMSFTSVAATLIQAVHDKYAGDHDGLVTNANGRIVRKKHHLALHLQHFGLGDAKTNALSKSLQQFPAIHILDLSDNRLTDAAIIPLLQNLEIAACALSASGGSGRSGSSSSGDRRLSSIVERIGSASARRKRGNELRRLNLSHNAIGKPGCAQVARFLGVCSLLTLLDLSHTNLGSDEALAPLTTAIECHPALQVVNLSYNNIGERGGVLLGDMITQPSCGLTELNVSWNQICRGGAVAIGAALRTNTALKVLNLAMNRCGDDGGEQLAAAMAANASLTDLNLSRNAFGGRTAVAFAFFLRQNASLAHLHIQDNRLGAVGTRALLRAVACGSRCEIEMSVHDVAEASSSADARGVFDFMLPWLSSPFELRLGASPYEFAVANLLLDAALVHRRCALSELVFADDPDTSAGRSKRVGLAVDADARCVVELPTRKPWRVPTSGSLSASARFVPAPMPTRSDLSDVDETAGSATTTRHETRLTSAACLGLVRVIQRGFSTREMLSLLDLALSDLFLTIDQATFFLDHLRGSLSAVEVVGRLWPCLIEGERVFAFLQMHLTPPEQRRLVDTFGAPVIQFSTANPTGRWTLDLGDARQRKIALWFASINAREAAHALQHHAKRTDSSQYGRGCSWRNASFNRRALRLTNDFFQQLPRSGVLEFDYVSTIRHEDIVVGSSDGVDSAEGVPTHSTPSPVELSDEALEQLMKQVGAEVCAIYIPLHKRKDLKYQLLLFHLAIADRFVTCEQAHFVLQHFPKNYDTCRLRILISVHRSLIDLENVGELLDRLTTVDRRRVFQALGYLNVMNPLCVDMDYEVDFEREDEKMLLRALVDLSMASPMDLIRIESERSDVLVIYSMYQTNSVPSTGKIFFRYVSHANASRGEWLKARQSLFRHFLCGERLRRLPESVLVSAMSLGAAGTTSARSSVVSVGLPRPSSAATE